MKRLAAGLALTLIAAVTVVTITAITLMGDEDSMFAGKLKLFASCPAGGIELSDTSCDELKSCTSKTMRLTWSRGGGALFEGDGTSEREVARLSGSRLGVLVSELASSLDVHPSDGPDRICGADGYDTKLCPAAGRKLGFSAECSGTRVGQVLMRASLRDRLGSESIPFCALNLHASDAERLRCRAKARARDVFGTHRSDRVIQMMERMKAVATGSDE